MGQLQPWQQTPSDPHLSDDTLNFLRWVQTSLNALMGRGAVPSPPLVTATGVVGGVYLTWTGVGAATFLIFENSVNTFSGATQVGSVAATVSGSNAFLRAGLGDTTTRFYFVQGINGTGVAGSPSIGVAGASASVNASSVTTAIVLVPAANSITAYWDGTNGSNPLTVYRDNGTKSGPFSANLAITGLAATTTYYFYPYVIDNGKGQVTFVSLSAAVGTPAVAFTAQSILAGQQQMLGGRIPLSNGGIAATTGGAAVSGGSGGTSGGAGRINVGA